jgi:hypothetical protein
LREPFKKLFVSTPPPVLLVVAHFGSPAAVQSTNGTEGGERILFQSAFLFSCTTSCK